MRLTARSTVAAFCLASTLVVLGACAGDGGADAPTGATPSPVATAAPEPTSEPTGSATADPSGEPSETQPPDVESAIGDLAERTGTEPSDISVVVHEPVTWSDGSIGCPEPGKAYTQALVEGWRLVLSADGAEYAYHGEREGPLTYCASPVPPADTGETS